MDKGTDFDGTEYKDRMILNYLEIPFDFLYTPKESGFFIGAGPAIAVGLSAKEKITPDEPTDKIKFGSGDDEIKRLEFSGNAVVGYEFAQGIMLSCNYNFGLSNLSNDNQTSGKVRNNYFGVRIGFLLGSSK